jgi:FkbM family methyltransferase
VFIKRYIKKTANGKYFDINGAKLPDVTGDRRRLKTLALDVFQDTFLVSCLYNDNYDKSIVEPLDCYMHEGPYGYTDGVFDVTVKPGDIVIDAGAWIGDFSAYCASKKASVYAFEPTNATFQFLCETAALNGGGGVITPVKNGLGAGVCQVPIFVHADESANTIISGRARDDSPSEIISITTLDRFVEEHSITKIDFIKADIEGAERDMLAGAVNVLKKFAPKLAICTYHLPDDPQVLEKIILEANPDYRIVHLRKKLFAAAVKK